MAKASTGGASPASIALGEEVAIIGGRGEPGAFVASVRTGKIEEKLEYHSQRRGTTAVALTKQGDAIVASKDAVILWPKSDDGLFRMQGQVLSKGQGAVEALATGDEGRRVALCTSKSVKIVRFEDNGTAFVLEGHSAPVASSAFVPGSAESLLATCSEDRTLKLWHLEKRRVEFDSGVLGASALTSVCAGGRPSQLAVGSADGALRIFDISRGRPRLIASIDAAGRSEAALAKMGAANSNDEGAPVRITAAPGRSSRAQISHDHQQSDDGNSSELAAEVSGPAGRALLLVTHISHPAPREGSSSHEGGGRLLPESPAMVAGSPRGLLYIDTRTYVAGPLATLQGLFEGVGAIGAVAVGPVDSSGKSIAAVGSAFGDEVRFLEIKPPASTSPQIGNGFPSEAGPADGVVEDGPEDAETESLSVFPQKPLPPDSPLLEELTSSLPTSRQSSKGRGGAGRGRSRGPPEKPVTFHAKVKSSGYGKDEPARLFKGKRGNGIARRERGSGRSSQSPVTEEGYPATGPPPAGKQASEDTAHAQACCAIRFAPHGDRLASAGAEGAARSIKLGGSGRHHQGEGTALVGHQGAVNSLAWSQDGAKLVTAGADRQAIVWRSGRPVPALRIAKEGEGRGQEFCAEVRAAGFAHMDRFLLVASGSAMRLFRYELGYGAGPGEAKHTGEPAKSKLIGKFKASAQQVLDFDCINSFPSNLAVCCLSNRGVAILDLAVGRWARESSEAHPRPPHCATMFGAGGSCPQPKEASELFATASSGLEGSGVVNLWDARQPEPARAFVGHPARLGASGLAFSPCLRFLATGSDDRTAWIFDLRQGSLLARARGSHSEPISSVDFHPSRPLLATGSLDGSVRTFSPSSTSPSPS